jgi:hypothetical protein
VTSKEWNLLGCFVEYKGREYLVVGGNMILCQGHPKHKVKEYELSLPGPYVAHFLVPAEELNFVSDPFKK